MKWIFIVDNGDGCPTAHSSLTKARKHLLGKHPEDYEQDTDSQQPGCAEVWVWIPNNEDNYIWKVKLDEY